jgi:hypothetical protein
LRSFLVAQRYALQSAMAFFTLFLFVQTGQAQSTLNFPRISQGGGLASQIVVTNPSQYFAEVQFTLFEEDGSPVGAGLVNPVSYQIRPRAQLALSPSLIFGEGRADGWVQASSGTNGLQGVYSIGDFAGGLASSEAAIPLTSQIIPYIPDGEGAGAEIVITNPGARAAAPTIVFYDSRGNDMPNPDRPTLDPHEQWSVTPPRGASWARVISQMGVVATEFATIDGSPVLINGQTSDSASTRVAPHFVSGGSFRSVLNLVNPGASPATITVTLNNRDRNEPLSRQTFDIPANGSRQARLADLWPGPFRSVESGWLLVETDGSPLAGLTLLDSGAGVTASALQTTPMERLLFSQVANNSLLYTGVALVNAGSRTAAVELTLSRVDGSAVGQRSITLAPNEKQAHILADLGLAPDGLEPGDAFLTVRASAPIFGLGVFARKEDGTFVSVEPVVGMSAGFVPNPIVARPSIVTMETVGGDARAGSAVQIFAENASSDTVVIFGTRSVPSRPGPSGSIMADVPQQTEPGYVSVRLRSGGRESRPELLRVASSDPVQLTATLEGRVFFQKFEVTDAGLDLTRPVYAPVRYGLVQVYDPSMDAVVSVSQTDELGRFKAAAPQKANLVVRVVSRRSDSALAVVDNTSGNAPYVITLENVNAIDPSWIRMVDSTRRSGAFNILEAIQRANDLIGLADPLWAPPGVTVFWSPRNTNRSGSPSEGLVGTTRFNVSANTAYVLGDRSTDSDEYDDAVILHEYAHMLAARFSRDDSPGGAHGMGQVEDPRLAWSEGLANFFSSAVRNDAVYRDSRGPNGVSILRYDLEDNVPAGDNPGYWSETSAGSLLWDLFDEHPDNGDSIQVSFPVIWTALGDLRNASYVYLPLFLDRFLDRNPGALEAARILARTRGIEYRSNGDASAADPFPRPIVSGEPVYGEVDSWTPRKTNLMQSSHFFWFMSKGGETIRLDIVGTGPANDSDANDLDLYLYDSNGKEVAVSNKVGNGQSELIRLQNLPQGVYIVEARSFFTRAKTGATAYNSGRYKLTLSR